MALSGILHGIGSIAMISGFGPPGPPPVWGVTALINTTTIKQMLHIICNDKTVILNNNEIQTAIKHRYLI